MSTDTRPADLYEVTDTMLRYGGSFASLFGQLLRAADMPNQARLLAAFPELIEEYRAMTALRKAGRGK